MRLLSALLMILLASLPASAGVLQEFSNEATFHAALATLTQTSFASTANGTYGCEGVSLGGIKFYGQFQPGPPQICAAYVASVTGPDPTVGTNWGFKFMRGENDTNSFLEILNMPAGTTAVGLNVMTWWKGRDVQIILNNGVASYTIATSSDTSAPTFWAVTTDFEITSVKVSTIGGFGQPLIANFDYGVAGAQEPPPPATTETPELMSMVMIGTGLLAISARRMQRPV